MQLVDDTFEEKVHRNLKLKLEAILKTTKDWWWLLIINLNVNMNFKGNELYMEKIRTVM